MNTIVILSLSALTVTGLALIHETRLREGAHGVLRHFLQSLRDRVHDRTRDGQ